MAEFNGLEHIVREREPLAQYGWLWTEGVAKYFAEPTTQDELATLVGQCREQGVAVKLLGGGSNVLVDSDEVDAMVIHLSSAAFSEIVAEGNLIKAKGATHDIAHKRPADYSGQWDRWRAEQHAYFLQRLKDTPEADGNMLDHTVVLWGSAHPHASHSPKNYPIHLAGGNKLGLKHGHLHSFEDDKKVPLANLFVSMLNAVDVPVKSFADSTGPMTEALA